jgi:capsular polysaccharide biosynthesis protein
MRAPWWTGLLAATAIGAGIGAAVAAAGHTEYKAEAKVVVQAQGGPAVVRPLLPNVRELATSSILAGNVDSTLRLPGSPDALRKRLGARIAAGSQVIVVSVTDRGHDRARQIAQEAAVVLTQLVQARFRTPPLNATVLDPAHVVSRHGRHFLRDALIGGAIGLALAGAALLATRRGLIAVSPPTEEKLAERERQLKERIDLVTKREREMARRAGELARRERAAALEESRAPAKAPPAVAKSAPPPQPDPEAAPPQQAAPVHDAASLPTLESLEALVRERGAEFPERGQEWADYLFFLREHAGADGRLPGNFSGLVQDVFGELLR